MSWVKLDDRIFLNPKFRAKEATTDARMLYLAGLTFSAPAESDGDILAGDLPLVFAYARVANPEAAVTALVKLQLWERVAGGYQIHDYLEYQFSREYLNAERERKRKVAAARRATTSVATSVATSAATVPATSDVPSRPVPSPDLPIGGSKKISLRSDQEPRRRAGPPTQEEINEINANAIGSEEV